MFKPSFLFLVYHGQLFPDLWKSYKDLPRFVYNKSPHRLDSFLRDATNINYFHKTGWAEIGIVDAMIELLSKAYNDTDSTHFVFCSGTCVPVLSCSEFLKSLRNQKKGIVSLGEKKPHRDKFSQWSIINRQFCEKILGIDRETIKDYTRKFLIQKQIEDHIHAAFDEIYIPAVCSYLGIVLEDFFDIRPVTHHEWHGSSAAFVTKSYFLSERKDLKNKGFFFKRKVMNGCTNR